MPVTTLRDVRRRLNVTIVLIVVTVVVFAGAYGFRERDKAIERRHQLEIVCRANEAQDAAIEEFLVDLFVDVLGATPQQIEDGRKRYHEAVDPAHDRCIGA